MGPCISHQGGEWETTKWGLGCQCGVRAPSPTCSYKTPTVLSSRSIKARERMIVIWCFCGANSGIEETEESRLHDLAEHAHPMAVGRPSHPSQSPSGRTASPERSTRGPPRYNHSLCQQMCFLSSASLEHSMVDSYVCLG